MVFRGLLNRNSIHGFVAGPWMAEKPRSDQRVMRFVTLAYCGEAFTFIPSFTGGSILMLGP